MLIIFTESERINVKMCFSVGGEPGTSTLSRWALPGGALTAAVIIWPLEPISAPPVMFTKLWERNAPVWKLDSDPNLTKTSAAAAEDFQHVWVKFIL